MSKGKTKVEVIRVEEYDDEVFTIVRDARSDGGMVGKVPPKEGAKNDQWSDSILPGRGSILRAKKNEFQLNDRQVQFCIEYCRTLNVAQAYANTYPSADLSKSRNYCQLLWAKPAIQAYVNKLMAKKVEEHELSLDETLKVLNQIMHDPKEAGSVKVQAADKLLKYFGGYVKHQEAGASKNLFLGMSEQDLNKNAGALLAQFKENNTKNRIAEEISFEEIIYEEQEVPSK